MPRGHLAPEARFALIRHGGYPWVTLWCVGASDAAITRRVIKEGGDPSELVPMEPWEDAYTQMLSCGLTVIRFRRFDGNAEDWALMAHEAFHAVEFLFGRLGIELTNPELD